MSTDPTEPSADLPSTPEAGALVPIEPTRIGRDASGRFAPGNSGGPDAGTAALDHRAASKDGASVGLQQRTQACSVPAEV
jgi:hypothetical protein